MCPTAEQLGITLMNENKPWLHGKTTGLVLNERGKELFSQHFGLESEDGKSVTVKLAVAKIKEDVITLATVAADGELYALPISLMQHDWLDRK